MTLKEHHVQSNTVRVPNPASGEAVVVDRYNRDQPKAVVLHPDDYAYLRETAALVSDAGAVAEAFSAAVMEARALEDRPRDELLVEDSERIAKLLDL